MKKAIITILGLQNPAFNDKALPYVKNYQHQVIYYFEDDTNKNDSLNLFRLPIIF